MKNPYALTPWTRPECYAGATWEGWLVFLGRNRDSDLLSNHNFDTAFERLSGVNSELPDDGTPWVDRDGVISGNTVEIVRESHWAVGWIEWIAIHPSNTQAVAMAEEMARDLDAYPVLDEDRWSEKEHDAVEESWAALSVQDRLELIQRVGTCSILAARRPYLPSDDNGSLYDVISGWL